uniref:Uncharacterized protein n=1 Tax=Geoglobus ahangari TaxID=113653 RepID=A0A7C3YP39_9EURY
MVKNIYNTDVLKEIDKKFRKKYEMGFEEFERVLELLIKHGFQEHEYFDKLIDDYIVWREVVYLLRRRLNRD